MAHQKQENIMKGHKGLEEKPSIIAALTLSFPGSPTGLPGPHTKGSRRSSCYYREVGVWVRLKTISVVLSLILASLGRFPRNFLPFSDSYTFLVYHQDI